MFVSSELETINLEIQISLKASKTLQKNTISFFLHDLQNGNSSEKLYDEYFYKGKPGEGGRNLSDINLYKDSIFLDIRRKLPQVRWKY